MYPYSEEWLRPFMLDHASVEFNHILTTKLADGCSHLFKADIHSCQRCCRENTLKLLISNWFISLTDMLGQNFLFLQHVEERDLLCVYKQLLPEHQIIRNVFKLIV